MTAEQIEFFRGTSAHTHCAVFGRGDSFILIPLGCGESPSLEVIVDGVERGFSLCGYVALCADCGGIATCVNLEAPHARLTMYLAQSRYAEMLSDRADEVARLQAMHSLIDPRWI
jgi:hypothetical protein